MAFFAPLAIIGAQLSGAKNPDGTLGARSLRTAHEDGRWIFPEVFRVKAPRFNDAVPVAARLQHMTRAEYARRALLKILEADGVQLRRGVVEVATQSG
jgi:hypothetical protein